MIIAVTTILVVCSVATTSWTQDRKALEKKLLKTLKGKTLTLRHPYVDSRLHFDSTGRLTKGSGKEGPWTVFSLLEITKVSVKKDRYEVRGKRIYVRFNQDFDTPVHVRSRSGVTLRWEAKPAQISEKHFYEVMRRLFLKTGESAHQTVPAYWREFLSTTRQATSKGCPKQTKDLDLPKNSAVPDEQEGGLGARQLGPKCIYCPAPQLTEETAVTGPPEPMTLIAFVGSSGCMKYVHILSGEGSAADETVLETIRTWRLQEKMEDGKPTTYNLLVRLRFPGAGTAAEFEYEEILREEISTPKCLACVNPEYTPAARQEKLSGVITLEGIVNTAGRVENVSIVKPLGFGLDDSGVAAILSWKFQPAEYKGKPIPYRVEIEISFDVYPY